MYFCHPMKIFPEHSLLVDEFEKVRELAANECYGQPGRTALAKVVLRTDFPEILKALEETDEMRKVISNGEPFPMESYADISGELKLLNIRNSVLTPSQILQLNKLIRMCGLVFGFFTGREERYPLLKLITATTEYKKEISEAVEKVMDETGFVLSSASLELGRIRKNLSRKRVESDQLYQSIISKYRKNGWVTDAEESWRNGRRVVSIVAEQKRAARGIIHDLSATGKTCFIEPEEAIGVNNMILSLEEEERMEIQRIMKELTEFLRKYFSFISEYFKIIVRFDVVSAKAKLALMMHAGLPYVEARPKVDVMDARHPLLFLYNKAAGKPTVPFNLSLQEDKRILVISGPNAGGKTVCMKTIGLLQMMLQSGFLVSADGNSRFGVFKNILVDIGDSQSLEFELSTYSSRLRHMKMFLQRADEHSLFLIDEFGTGTDPSLGGALAESILEELNHKKAVGIITTHYMNLKVLADRTKGIINGSMAFDARKLEPQFRLEVGKPGSSYTFVVAERSGLPHSVINRARKKVKRNTLLLEELLTKMEHEKAEVARLMDVNKQQERKLNELVNKYEKNVAHQEQKYEQNEERVRQKELRLAKQMEDQFNRFVRDWKDAKNKKAVLEKYNKRLQERKNVLSAKDQMKLEELVAYNKKHLKKGSIVRLKNGKVTGQVELVKDMKVVVLFGNVRTTAELGNLMLVEEKEKSNSVKPATKKETRL